MIDDNNRIIGLNDFTNECGWFQIAILSNVCLFNAVGAVILEALSSTPSINGELGLKDAA